MNMILIIVIFFVIARSIIQFITHGEKDTNIKTHKTSISLEVFYTLIMIYCIVIVGFGLIYFMLSFYELTLVENVENGDSSLISLFFRSFYFSGVTLLTIGYGDITPIGIGRFIAVIQALIGYLLPTAFVLKIVHINFQQKT
ncbi:potassium channel family protein [Pseudogracilibacillus sp. SE30717A]|uniref:potassium channel family protein n=1 Tax=Pseudogracilibacillus sp. SE30717A TaxID=3098293 RepID=UPI00300E060D